MTTPRSTSAALDLETEATTDEFGTNVGAAVSQQLQSHRRVEPKQRSRCNVGGLERKVRLGTGSALLAAAAFAPVSRAWRIGLALVGAAELVTGAMRYCPLNQALGINTCRADEA